MNNNFPDYTSRYHGCWWWTWHWTMLATSEYWENDSPGYISPSSNWDFGAIYCWSVFKVKCSPSTWPSQPLSQRPRLLSGQSGHDGGFLLADIDHMPLMWPLIGWCWSRRSLLTPSASILITQTIKFLPHSWDLRK